MINKSPNCEKFTDKSHLEIFLVLLLSPAGRKFGYMPESLDISMNHISKKLGNFTTSLSIFPEIPRIEGRNITVFAECIRQV